MRGAVLFENYSNYLNDCLNCGAGRRLASSNYAEPFDDYFIVISPLIIISHAPHHRAAQSLGGLGGSAYRAGATPYFPTRVTEGGHSIEAVPASVLHSLLAEQPQHDVDDVQLGQYLLSTLSVTMLLRGASVEEYQRYYQRSNYL